MNIALIAHDEKKELMVQFCIAYCGVLSRNNLCATGTTGKMLCISQRRSIFISLGSFGFGLSGSLKKRSISISLHAILAAIC